MTEDDLARLERLAREGGVGVDLAKMSKDDILKRLYNMGLEAGKAQG